MRRPFCKENAGEVNFDGLVMIGGEDAEIE
jgi:hypothetical protein